MAFGLGLIHKLDVKQFNIQSVVLCPTRELADQVANEIRNLARIISNIRVLTLYGGVPLRPQASSLQYGAHIIVGTPGRIEDHINIGTLDLTFVSTLLLDEADRMLAMGFADSLKAIIRQIPKKTPNLVSMLIAGAAPSVLEKPTSIKSRNANGITSNIPQARHNNTNALLICRP